MTSSPDNTVEKILSKFVGCKLPHPKYMTCEWCDELPEAKQALTSLMKELVAEAKPYIHTPKGHQPEACYNHEKYTSACCGCQRQRARLHALDQFEQNLLKALEEVLARLTYVKAIA